MQNELFGKTSLIQNLTKEKAATEKSIEKGKLPERTSIRDQTEELNELNQKYKNALGDKVDIYNDMIDTLK